MKQHLPVRRQRRETYLLARLACGTAISTLLGTLSASAGSFFSDFDLGLPDATATYGTASVDPNGGVNDSGVLKITRAQNNENGAFIVEDLDEGQPISAFTVNFKALVGGGTASPAEGFALNFANDLPNSVFGSPQFGNGTGLSVLFQLFNVTGNPKMIVRFNGVDVVETIFRDFVTGSSFVDVTVKLDPGGALDVIYNGKAVYSNLFAYTPIAGRFALAGNTGNQNANMWIENLSIETTRLDAPYVASMTPPPVKASPLTPVRIEIRDQTTEVVPESVTMKFNGNPVVASATKAGDTTTVFYDPPGLLPAGSRNNVQVTFRNNAVPAQTTTLEYDFQVAQVVIVPGSDATQESSIDKSKPGFNVRTVQARSDAGLPPTFDRAQRHLAGLLIDPQTAEPFVNEIDPTGSDENGFFPDADVINYEAKAGSSGNFTTSSDPAFADEPFPGVAPEGANANNISLEAITWLELKTGVYKMGVNSDDGFALQVGANPKDLFAITLGSFDDPAGRTAADTTFDVFVGADGFYPFRLVYTQGSGGSGLEWFTVDVATGKRILINDVNTPNAVRAYRGGISRPYVSSVSPAPGAVGVQPGSTIEIGITDGGTQLAPSQVRLVLNGTPVTPNLSKPAGSPVTTLSYNPGAALLPTNTVVLEYGDNANPSNRATNSFSFVLLPFLGDQPARVQDSGPDGLLVLEAEHYDRSVSRADLSWLPAPAELLSDFSGDGAMMVPNTGLNVNIDVSRSPELDFKVKFVRTGRHYVWVRGLAPNVEPGLSGGNDSVNTGLDEILLASSDRIVNFNAGYTWQGRTADGNLPATIDVATTGEHHFNLFMREDGFIADKIVITSSETYVPSDFGPEESPREAVVVRPTLAISAVGATVVVSWAKSGSDGFALEQASSLAAPIAWSAVTTGVVDSGERRTVTVASGAGARYYRLSKP